MRTTTQKVAMVFGVVFLLVGVLGLLVPGGMGMEADTETAPRLLNLFPVNLLHNLVHLAFGAWGLLASRRHDSARAYCRIAAVIYAVLVVMAFVSDSTFGLVPIGSHDIWLHAVLAAALGYFGFVHREAGVPANS
jgi:hypothetical protein